MTAEDNPVRPIITILLVDDHDLVLLALHNYLEKNGYNLLEARNGEEALLIAECFPSTIHVLVTDIVMPRLNGRELMQQLIPLRPAMQVIMMSGFPDEVMAQQSLTPLVPVLRKPFKAKRLLRAVKEVLADPRVERTVTGLSQWPPSQPPEARRAMA